MLDHPEFHNIDDASDAIVRELAPGVMANIYPGHQAMFSVVTVEPGGEGVLHDHPQDAGAGRRRGAVRQGRLLAHPGGVPHTMRAGADGCRILDVFAPPRDEYRVAGSGLGA